MIQGFDTLYHFEDGKLAQVDHHLQVIETHFGLNVEVFCRRGCVRFLLRKRSRRTSWIASEGRCSS